MLTGKSWKLTAVTVSPAMTILGVSITDWYAQLDACEQDNITYFKTGGTYTIEEGATKCDSSDPQVYDTGTWTFNSDETILVLTSTGGTPESCNITSISSSSIKITYQETYSSVKYTFTVTYTAQ